MFGYIRPLECELKVREQKEYRAYYCGLCKTIGRRYGLAVRLCLSYDCAFLAALLAAMEGKAACEPQRCALKPLRGKEPCACDSEALSYAADVNVLLWYYQAADHWADERKLSALAVRTVMGPAFRKARRLRPALSAAIRRQLDALHRLEAQNAACTDEPSDAFGVLMEELIRCAPMLSDENRAACGWMFYNLGRWVYLLDAWDDREKDRRRGAYNPFLTTGMDEDAAAFLLYVSLTEAEKGYDLVNLEGEQGLLDNIVHLGCRTKTRSIVHESV